MANRIFNLITSPILGYLEATVAIPCQSWSAKDEMPQEEHHSQKAEEARGSQRQRYSYRPRKQSFSLLTCIQRQREMASPRSLERSDFVDTWSEEVIISVVPSSHSKTVQ